MATLLGAPGAPQNRPGSQRATQLPVGMAVAVGGALLIDSAIGRAIAMPGYWMFAQALAINRPSSGRCRCFCWRW